MKVQIVKIKFKALKVDPASALIHHALRPRMQPKGPPKRHVRARGKKRVKSDVNQEKKEKEEKNERKEIRINKRQPKQQKMSSLLKSLKQRNLRTMHRQLLRLPKLRRKFKRGRQGYLTLLAQLTLKMRMTIKPKGSSLMETIRSH